MYACDVYVCMNGIFERMTIIIMCRARFSFWPGKSVFLLIRQAKPLGRTEKREGGVGLSASTGLVLELASSDCCGGGGR